VHGKGWDGERGNSIELYLGNLKKYTMHSFGKAIHFVAALFP